MVWGPEDECSLRCPDLGEGIAARLFSCGSVVGRTTCVDPRSSGRESGGGADGEPLCTYVPWGCEIPSRIIWTISSKGCSRIVSGLFGFFCIAASRPNPRDRSV